MDESRIITRDRIFLGFSSIDRYEVIESILYHLANYGIAMWYDRHKMRLGDCYDEIFSDGILNTKYAVVVFTKNTDKANCFAQEIEYIRQQYNEGLIKVFPLLYKTTLHELPQQFSWVSELIYKEFDDKSGTALICNHIMSSILADELKKCTYQTLYELLRSLSRNENDIFIEKILLAYMDVDRNNHNSRIAVLYCLYTHITLKYGIAEMLPQHYWRCFDRLFSYTKLHLSIDQREILILELSIMILINKLFY